MFARIETDHQIASPDAVDLNAIASLRAERDHYQSLKSLLEAVRKVRGEQQEEVMPLTPGPEAGQSKRASRL